MGDLVGLPGVKGRIKNAKFASSVSGAMKILLTERAVTGAGDHGAWTVWRDDAGVLQCALSRWRLTVNAKACKTKAEVREWLKEWLPAVEEAHK